MIENHITTNSDLKDVQKDVDMTLQLCTDKISCPISAAVNQVFKDSTPP